MLKRFSVIAVLCGLAIPAWSVDGRTDYDADDDGLIEIQDLADFDELRNDLTGKTLYGSNAGCPAEGCRGVELTVDLDFDTNQDGVIDASDTYWNAGKGWEPIGIYSDAFRGFFEGNGYIVRNLYIDRPDQSEVGLFGSLGHKTVRRTGIAGKLTFVRGKNMTGTLAGSFFSRNDRYR